MSPSDAYFGGPVPQIYEKYLVPLIFEPYAPDVAARVAALKPRRVLEIAAGTGVATRALAKALPASTAIIATDLNQAMIDEAQARGTARPVEWKQADALHLPFPDASFDVVVCQFGVMFFPDRVAAYAESRRVLREGGTFLFVAWDRIEENVFTDVVTNALAELFPKNPPRFMARTPHGYHDIVQMRRDLAAARFAEPKIEIVPDISRGESAEAVATAIVMGTPLRNEIEEAGGEIEKAMRHAARAVESGYGRGPIEAKIQAIVVTAKR